MSVPQIEKESLPIRNQLKMPSTLSKAPFLNNRTATINSSMPRVLQIRDLPKVEVLIISMFPIMVEVALVVLVDKEELMVSIWAEESEERPYLRKLNFLLNIFLSKLVI